MKSHTKVVALCSLAGFIVVGGIWVHQQNVISGNQHRTHIKRVSANRYKHDADTYTVAKAERNYDKAKPKLGTVLQTNRTKMIKGLGWAFNGSLRPSDYDKHKGTVSSYLGSDVGDEVLKYVQPQVIIESSSSKPISIAKSMTDCKVSYGKFDDSENTVPVTALVTFKTPPLNTKMGGFNTSAKKVVPHPHVGHAFISAILSTKDGSMTLTHNYHSVDGL